MYLIVADTKEFGRGYFTGFDARRPCFSSSIKHVEVKRYKLLRNAEKQLKRLEGYGSRIEGSTYKIMPEGQ